MTNIGKYISNYKKRITILPTILQVPEATPAYTQNYHYNRIHVLPQDRCAEKWGYLLSVVWQHT